MSSIEQWGPDEWIPREYTGARLAQMPLLAAQAAELGQTRNPSGARGDHVFSGFGARPPARLDLIDAADGPTVPHELAILMTWCSRVIWEALDDQTKAMHPQPIGTPTWATECAWLAGVWNDSRAWLDETDLQMTSMTLDDAYRQLARTVGLKPGHRLVCPECGASLIEDGDMLVCENTIGHPWRHEFPGAARMAADWRDHELMTTPECAEQIPGCTERKIRLWRDAHKIQPAATRKSRHGRPTELWEPWDILRLAFPGIDESREEAAA